MILHLLRIQTRSDAVHHHSVNLTTDTPPVPFSTVFPCVTIKARWIIGWRHTFTHTHPHSPNLLLTPFRSRRTCKVLKSKSGLEGDWTHWPQKWGLRRLSNKYWLLRHWKETYWCFILFQKYVFLFLPSWNMREFLVQSSLLFDSCSQASVQIWQVVMALYELRESLNWWLWPQILAQLHINTNCAFEFRALHWIQLVVIYLSNDSFTV